MIFRPALLGAGIALAAISALPAAPSALHAQAADTAYFVLRIGSDTVALERYTRTPTSFSGRQLLRTPRTTQRDFTATLDAEGNATEVEIRISRPGEPGPLSLARVEFGTDGAEVMLRQGDSTTVSTIGVLRGTIPFLGYAVGFYELPLARHRSGGGATTRAPLLPVGSTTIYEVEISGTGEWLTVSNIAGANRVRVDPNGRILSWDGTGSTLKLEGERLETLDFEGLAAAFVERERTGQSLGALSPRDSVMTTLAGANVRVDYGRPARRGRTIAGDVVPWGEVWRTGANQATQLTTDRDLMIGDTRVPAGAYSLWTIPRPEGWTLILNRQTGQWGTDHDPAQDLARIPMRSEPAGDRLERFTITLEPEGEDGRIALMWDDIRVWVPVSPVP
jgi:hypothetical protein